MQHGATAVAQVPTQRLLLILKGHNIAHLCTVCNNVCIHVYMRMNGMQQVFPRRLELFLNGSTFNKEYVVYDL